MFPSWGSFKMTLLNVYDILIITVFDILVSMTLVECLCQCLIR